MIAKTPEQIEDANIADVISTVVAIKTRKIHRELKNRIVEQVMPKIDLARLQGKAIDVEKFVAEVMKEVEYLEAFV